MITTQQNKRRLEKMRKRVVCRFSSIYQNCLEPEDIYQAAVIKLIEKGYSEDEIVQEGHYVLLGLMKFLFLNLYKKENRRKSLFAQHFPQHDSEGALPNIEHFLSLCEEIEAALNPQQKHIFLLTLEGYRQVEIAAVLGMDTSTVSRELKTIRKIIENILTPPEPEPRGPPGLNKKALNGKALESQNKCISRKSANKILVTQGVQDMEKLKRSIAARLKQIIFSLPAFLEIEEKSHH